MAWESYKLSTIYDGSCHWGNLLLPAISRAGVVSCNCTSQKKILLGRYPWLFELIQEYRFGTHSMKRSFCETLRVEYRLQVDWSGVGFDECVSLETRFSDQLSFPCFSDLFLFSFGLDAFEERYLEVTCISWCFLICAKFDSWRGWSGSVESCSLWWSDGTSSRDAQEEEGTNWKYSSHG